MTFFTRPQDDLMCGDIALRDILTDIETPFYCYTLDGVTERILKIKNAFKQHSLSPLIAYAVKANHHMPILASLAAQDIGADIVSQGEMRRALSANIPPHKIIFSGVGKTNEELKNALKHNIKQFNVESKEELMTLAHIAHTMDCIAPCALRLNPDINAPTHDKIATGRKEDKFGISHQDILPLLKFIAEHKNLSWQGFAIHIGSQIFDLAIFKQAFRFLKSCDELAEQNNFGTAPSFDLGGGLGTSLSQEIDLEGYVRLVKNILPPRPLILEPGRFIVAPCGILISRIVRIKKSAPFDFIILDVGMNDLMRPALYDAPHPLIPVDKPRTASMKAHVVGPICESGDIFAKKQTLPLLKEGEAVALMEAGAYGAVMASCYNARPLIKEVTLQGKNWMLTKPALTNDQIMTSEIIPAWMTS